MGAARGTPQRVKMHKMQVSQRGAQGTQTEPEAGKTKRNGGHANKGDVHVQEGEEMLWLRHRQSPLPTLKFAQIREAAFARLLRGYFLSTQ